MQQQTDNNFQSLRDYSSPRRPSSILPHLQQLQQLQQQQQQALMHTTANVEQQNIQPLPPQIENNSGGMIVSDYQCLTCSGPILENTTSTTTCVKCARLRTRRKAFAHPWDTHQQQLILQQQQQLHHQNSQHQFVHSPLNESMESERVSGPHDSRDSGVSSGSSQDYGGFTPTTEKSIIFPSRYSFGNRVSLDRQSVQFSQLVRKLSEVEGIAPNILMKTSIDEGVCIEEPSKYLPDDPYSRDQMQLNTNFEGSWKPQHQLSQGSTFDSVSMDRSCSIVSPITEQLPYHCPTESTQESTSYAEKNNQQNTYPSGQSGASCSAFPSGGNSDGPLNSDLTASLPSCTQGGSVLPCTHSTDTAKHIQLGRTGNRSATSNTSSEASDFRATTDISKMSHYLQQQQQYKYVPMYPQHLTPGMKRFLHQSHLQQKQNLLSVLHEPHQQSSTSSPRRVRSPISFREGRRASDGYVGTCSPFANTVAFPQRLYDKSKAGGYFELHDVREEHKALQNQFGSGNRPTVAQADTSCGTILTGQTEEGVRCDTPPELAHQGRLSAAKRISLPENFAYFSSTSGLVASTPTSSNTMAGNINANDPYGASFVLQQQMLQHRMRPSTSSSRRTSRPNSYGFYPPQSHQQGLSSDFLFQPIAEDEADGIPMSPHEHSTRPECIKELSPPVTGQDETKNNNVTVPSTLPLTKMCLPSKPDRKHHVMSMEQDTKGSNWQTLTNDMEVSCRLTETITKDGEPTCSDNKELNSFPDEQSADIISSSGPRDQQYSYDYVHVDETISIEGESMDISNIEK